LFATPTRDEEEEEYEGLLSRSLSEIEESDGEQQEADVSPVIQVAFPASSPFARRSWYTDTSPSPTFFTPNTTDDIPPDTTCNTPGFVTPNN
jgi:hypothetical protein